ncbi:MAG: DEAD/DEAH box helicase family protein [bacterium]|nr:DEAD/DEAH box helicase family protein [bacterium]
MKPGIYLEEALKDVLRTSNFVHGMFNLIVAPCGSGKTTAAINVISKLASSPRTALMLIDTRNGVERLAQEKVLTTPYAFYEESIQQTWFPSDEFDPTQIVVTTYAQFGVWEYHNPGFHSFFDVIICDEAHNMVKFPNFKDKKKKTTPQINYAAIARDALCRGVWECNTLIVGMTATPKALAKLNCNIYRIPIDESKLRRYESKEIISYRSLPQLLRQLPAGKRGALYITHVRQMERCEQIAIEAGMKPICAWSLNHEKSMTQEQLAARDYILTNERVPPQYDLFIFNKSCETSINLRGHLDYIIVHSREEDTRTQARGRYRDDLDVLYVYEPDVEQDIVVPDDFLDVYIYKEDKTKLRAQIDMKDAKGHPKPYNQLFMLVEASGYQLEHGRKNNRPYIIIREL